ncbi:MAG: ABC transporter permease subunit [Candidatus Aminicenantes bacterium]|nr:ABC transporter permease subunit [Candidatus Aminicenantes bacterium]NIM81134.1 ABC transporter permease subunit [Candidatus Aminicenantes bacterium]NIN20508.1 ABC transporter permease subunit [Candidatus Aminicenantes bacterium]NIN44281.1 ABC transporter permease subunit [Candidatus Aminicenantes bacterium]NIN87100.1 ABC transporter permease subunit [Candidatus Aminicenantes bacterium]
MKKILVIFRKELKDTLRDRRTIMMMVLLPVMMIYLLMHLTVSMRVQHEQKAREKVLNVALITKGNADAFRTKLMERKDMVIKENIQQDKIEGLIKNNELDFAVVFEKDFDKKVNEKQSGDVDVYFKASSEMEIAKQRIIKALREYKKDLLDGRLKEQELGEAFVEPLKIDEKDLATMKEKFGEGMGGLVPYFFILFCFIGAMYPAIDLAAGEKERATMETLLTSPASRMQIVIGKFLVVTLAGIFSAIISILALYLSLRQTRGLPKGALEALIRIIEPQSIALMLSLLIPLCIFFAAALLSVSLFARSFKEAQSIIAPLNILVIVPVLIAIFPGVKLNATTALVPVMNVSLATKDIISGTIKTGLLAEVYISLIVLAVLGLFFCTWWFKREEVIFRGI